MAKFSKNSFFVLFLTISFLIFSILPFTNNKLEAAQFNMSVDFLIETGVSFFDKGRYADAINEFKKALLIDPNSMVAREFLRQIEKEVFGEEKKESRQISKVLALSDALDRAELKKELIQALPPEQQKDLLSKKTVPAQEVLSQQVIPQGFELIKPAQTIILNEEIKATQPNTFLEIEKGNTVLIQGNNIKRFLNTTPDRINIARKDENNLFITAVDVGDGIFHIWDNSGRWTFDFEGKRKTFFGTFEEEQKRKDSERGLSEPFKLSYSFDWSSFHTGRRLDTTQRQSLSFNQSYSLRGETPYGNYDSSTSISRLNKQYETNNLTMGLTDAHFWGLEHLNIRTFDFSPGFGGYHFPSADLRGVNVSAPMFSGKINYNVFHGGLPEGNYTHLSPGLGRTKDAFLEGIGLSYKYSNNAQYKFYYAHTYGSEISQPALTDKAFGWGTFYKIGRLSFSPDIAYDDNEHISYTMSSSLSLPKTSLSLGFTEEDGDFVSPLGGGGSGGGSTSARFGINFSPTSNLSLSHNFSAVRDRNSFNPNDPKRPNYNLSSSASLRLDPFTSINTSFTRDDTKGSISPGISKTKTLGISRQFFFIKRLNTYLNYSNSTSKYFTSSASNFARNGLSGGLSFSLLRDVSLSVNKNINFIENTITKEHASSHSMETAMSYSSRILTSPFYGSLRISYRDEEETESAISYLSGEDRLEFSGDIDFRPNSYISGYLSLRVSNIWAENEGTAKHLDAEVRYGLRLVWDTGLCWNTKGNVEGFVFNDLDGNGSKDKEETGVKEVGIKVSKEKTAVTNDDGHYKISSIVGKKAQVNIDLNTVPRGYILTTPASYEISIKHGSTQRFDFGVTTRSEIVGLVFVDSNGNNKFDREEKSLSGVVMILDDKEKTITDQGGQYLFRKLSPGEHDLAIDLKTIPSHYIPKIPLKKKITIKEGEAFFYNVPLRATIQAE